MWSMRAIAVVAAVVVGALLFGSEASAQGTTLRLGRITVGPAGSGTLQLQARGLAAPGLGAWEINVNYDPAIVTLNSCTPAPGAICNTAFAPNAARAVGATAAGITGNLTIASLNFSCDRVGATDVTIKIDVFVNATPGSPMPIATKVVNGSITCSSGPVAGLGDVNCDGVVNAIDAELVLQYEAGLIDTLPCLGNGDMNGDGEVDAIDAFLILVLVGQP